jgi:hypothetical protein
MKWDVSKFCVAFDMVKELHVLGITEDDVKS